MGKVLLLFCFTRENGRVNQRKNVLFKTTVPIDFLSWFVNIWGRLTRERNKLWVF